MGFLAWTALSVGVTLILGIGVLWLLDGRLLPREDRRDPHKQNGD